MTNPQTEARAIRDRLCMECVCTFDAGCGCIEVIAAALAAKDAELAEAKAQLQRQFDQTVRFQGYLIEAKAQLAAANKALEPFAKATGHFDGHVKDDDDVSIALRDIKARHLRAARRALEAQGGELG